MSSPWKPTPAQIAAARDTTIPDVIGHDLLVLFCGINPSLYSAAVGHHFARPGNRFWPALQAGGFGDRQLSPFEDRLLLDMRCGITNMVARATAAADQLTDDELRSGARTLVRKLRRYRPATIAFLGISAFRTAFGLKGAKLGAQEERMGETVVWVLPNPSGLNAHYQLPELGRQFAELRRAVTSPEM